MVKNNIKRMRLRDERWDLCSTARLYVRSHHVGRWGRIAIQGSDRKTKSVSIIRLFRNMLYISVGR